MVSRNKAKFIKSLQLKKYRKQEGAFVVQGAKSSLELLNADFELLMLVATKDFLEKQEKAVSRANCEILEATESELSSLGYFKTSRDVLMVARTKPNEYKKNGADEFILILDNIQDPGNMGTIIRIADWYGIPQIVASPDSAELYNPKVLQASMGSFIRVNVFYANLEDFLAKISGITIYGALLEGKNLHHTSFSKGGAILIGNESKGISSSLMRFIDEKISIPRYGKAESLNAAIATAIICDKLKWSPARGGSPD